MTASGTGSTRRPAAEPAVPASTVRDDAPRGGWRALRPHALVALLAVSGVVLRLSDPVADDRGAGLLAMGGLGIAAALGGYLLLVRWGVWRWLAALAVAPALVGPQFRVAEALARPSVLVAALLVAALLAMGWTSRPPLPALIASAALVVAALLVDATAHAGDRSDQAAWLVGRVGSGWLTAFGGCLALAVAAAAGLGRARGSGLGPVTALAALASAALPAAAVADGGVTGRSLVPALVLAPAAAALGLTALARGRRGRAVERPQADDVDEAAAAAFAADHGSAGVAPVAIVIAAYNEADGIGRVLAELPDRACGLAVDVVVVDDGSTDGTAAAIASLDLPRPPLLVTPGVNRGQGAALRLGYRVAREHGARLIVTTDADGQYDPADIETVLRPVAEGEADFATGSRLLGRQDTRDRVRRAGVHVFAWTVTAMVGQRTTDTSFGLRAMRAEVTAAVTLNQPQYQSSELLLGAHSHGFRVVEVPARMRVRSAGASKKGRNAVYGRRYAGVVFGTWWREGCPFPAPDRAPATTGARR